MTIPTRRIQIALVGFDYERILKPIQDAPPNKIYLLFDNKKDDYGKLSKKFADRINKALGGIIRSEMIGFNPWNFKDCFEKIMNIFEEEKNADITVNISSSTNLAVAAAVYAASIYNARIVYVRGEYKALPSLTKKASAARDSPLFIDPFTPTQLNADELNILKIIYQSGGEIESLTQLTYLLSSSGTKGKIKDLRNKRALLSYKIKKLDGLGYVKRITSEKRNRVGVQLTDAGEVMGKLMADK